MKQSVLLFYGGGCYVFVHFISTFLFVSFFSGIVSANTFLKLFIDKCYKRFGAIVILIIPFWR